MQCRHFAQISKATGWVILPLFFATHSLGQSPVTLQPLAPIQPQPSLGPAPIPTMVPIPLAPPSEVTLQGIPRLTAAARQETGQEAGDRSKVPAPLRVDRLRPAPSTPAKASGTQAGQLSVDAMIRTPIDHVQALARVNARPPEATELQMLATVRGQHLDGDAFAEWNTMGYCWSSPTFCHRPLYFEQPNLERYGIGHGHYVDPWLSAAHFYGNVMVLPFKATWNPCWSKSCTLGNNRPGDCVPVQRQGIHAKVNRVVESRHIGEG